MQYNDFEFDNNYDPQTGFVRVRYGTNRALLETELNEMQKIQQENRSSLIRKMTPSGFVSLKPANVSEDNVIICNPNNVPYTIALAPSRLFLDGFEVHIEGSDTINNIPGYLTIQMPESSSSLYRADFVFLEFWFEELTYQSSVNKYGYVNGEILTNTMIDSRVNDETSRRIALRWRVRVTQDQNFDKWPLGFGYNSDTDFSPNYAYGAKNVPIQKNQYVFMPATDSTFESCPFYGDNGLWIAGRPDFTDTNTDLGIVENYVYAIPILKVERRNTGVYSISNPNGASQWIDSTSQSDHPDGLFYNLFIKDDISDIRRTTTFGDRTLDACLEQALKDLVTGNLLTAENETMHRIQFGAKSIDSSTDSSIIFISHLENSTLAADGTTSGTISGDAPVYSFGAVGSGLVLNGKTTVKYTIPQFNKQLGAIDCFFKPFWDGSDSTITQNIISVIDTASGVKALELTKNGTNLVVYNRMDSSGLLSAEIITYVDLLKYTMKAGKLHHIRVTWSYANKELKVLLNGNLVASNDYDLTSLNPNTLQLGEIETYDSNAVSINSLIDEVVVYNKEMTSNFYQLEEDFIENKASFYPSFGNYLDGSSDNGFEQNDFVQKIVTTNASTTFVVNTISGILISNSAIPTVYDLNGNTYTGTWSGLGTASATFTLTTSPSNGTTFTGETVLVQYNILIPSGNGIFELPTEVLKAQLNWSEAGFNVISGSQRSVTLVNPRTTVGQTDKAFDYNTSRSNDECFARLLYYYIEGNGQNKYQIPSNLYGFDVIGVRFVSLPYTKIMKVLSATPANDYFEIDLTNALVSGSFVEVHLLLGGMTFDYKTYTKNLVYKSLKTTSLTLNAPGNNDTFKIPVDVSSGYNTIVASAATVNAEPATQVSYYAYVDGVQTQLTSVSGFGTPFLTVQFPSTPLIGQKIEIPVLANYSASSNDIISVWIKHVPYQGTLTSDSQELIRVSKWLPFTTTLSSGNLIMSDPVPAKSINNAFNRLPGGGTFTSLLTSEPIVFKTDNFTDYSGTTTNKYFVTHRELRNATVNGSLDNYFIELDKTFTISKDKGQYQDGKLQLPFSSFGFYLPDTTNPIHKYAGAACLVTNENGEIMMFVFGHTHNFNSSVSTVAKPVYGDLFYVKNRPIVLIKNIINQ